MSNLIPVSRKEQYLSKIDGMTNKSPDKTYTKEEYFFSEILGEALHKPVLETRYEMYLAKIAGREIGIPYPETRLEKFLAKAAGMNISVPTPITREEMYWSTYSPFYLSNSSGTSPLTYGKCKIGTLSNYRIYGNTVDGNSVGDRTGNLFDEVYPNIVENTILYKSIYVGSGDFTLSSNIPDTPQSGAALFFLTGQVTSGANNESNNVNINTSRTVSSSNGYVTIAYRRRSNVDPRNYHTMLNTGSTPLPYEPYGYKVSVTVEGKNLYKISTFRDGSTSAVVSAVTFTINNNAVSISGISSAQHPSVTSQRFELISGETYSAKIFVDGSYDGKMYIIMRGGKRQDGSDEVIYKRIDVGSGDTFVAKTYNSIIYVAEGTNKEFNAIVRVILIKGSMLPDTYEPYHAPVTTPIYLPEQIRKVGDEAEYIDYGEQKFVKKFYKITLNFDDMNNSETFPGWSGGTAVVEYCNKIRSLAIKTPDGYMPIQYSSISNFKAIINVRNNGSILFLGASFDIGHTQSELKEIYAGRSITFILKIPDTELDVTLPALPTLPGTNVLSVGAEVQPSHVFVEFYKEREYG